jgi:hypothetical protein
VGGSGERPNVVGTPYIIGTGAEYFNTAAFALQPLGQFGNEGINVVQGPGISNDFNMSFYRNFAIKERANVRIGGEFSTSSTTQTSRPLGRHLPPPRMAKLQRPWTHEIFNSVHA